MRLVRVAQLELARRPVVVCVGCEDVADGRRSGRGGRTRRAGAGEVEVFVPREHQRVDHVDEHRPVVSAGPRFGPRLFRAAHDGDGDGAEDHGVLVYLQIAYRWDAVALDDELHRAAASRRLDGAQHGVVRVAFVEFADGLHHPGHAHLIDDRVARVFVRLGDRGAAEAAHVGVSWVL